jgi:mono/diheme cytochrome c family protein
MSQNSPKPDLEDTINVSDTHGRLVREAAATAREKRVSDNGMEPVSLWVFVVCGVVLLVAGGILGGGGNLFAYGDVFRPAYVRSAPVGLEDGGVPPRAALAAYSARGGRIYSARCQGCHGPDGRGDGANYPSLAGSAWVTGDSQVLAMVILNGLQGPTSTGRTYGAGVMPPQGGGMSVQDLASLMTNVRNSFGNSTGDVITAEMAQAALDAAAARENPGAMMTADELASVHSQPLAGTPLDPETLVDPVTLIPAQ